jgi:GNAT superfamily N-acetyltransferase
MAEGSPGRRLSPGRPRPVSRRPPARGIAVRPLAAGELELLERRILRPSGMHRERLGMQRDGLALYLIAWHDGAPVGQVLLRWAGTMREPMASRLAPCPSLSDLFVVAEQRSRGIGSRLLAVAEALVRRRGFERIGLGVATDNVGARALYARRGYLDSGCGQYRIRWVDAEAAGADPLREELCLYLVKRLAPPPDR